MAGSFEEAGLALVRRLEAALVATAREIMVESIQECPISGPETYVPQFRTRGRGPARDVMFIGLDPDMTGDAGTLRRSARIFQPRNDGRTVTVVMGYGFGEEVNPAGRLAAEYAVPVHERTDLQHAPPTKSGYLLDPVLAHAGSFEGELAMRMREQGEGFPIEASYGAAVADGQDLGAE